MENLSSLSSQVIESSHSTSTSRSEDRHQQLPKQLPDYLVVEGPIGVGKTTLARRIAKSYGTELLLEAPQKNPFLDRFYETEQSNALATQLYFLLQRVQQLNGLRQSDLFTPVRVADFLINKDQLFAELTLDADELNLYQQLYSHLTIDAPQPDLVVYLQAPSSVLLQRIAKRGIQAEKNITADYLDKLSQLYTQFFYRYTATPLLIVNAENANFADNDADYTLLLQQISKTKNGKVYFNPGHSTLPFNYEK